MYTSMTWIKFIGIGGCGLNILGKNPDNEKMPFLALDTCVCPFNWLTMDKILCGVKLCRGLGAFGSVERGYAAAHETLFDKMDNFYDNEVNVFVLGLGGGAGTGMCRYILDQMHGEIGHNKMYREELVDHRLQKEKQFVNKYNILLCTYPFNREEGRITKADRLLEDLQKQFQGTVDLVILARLERLSVGAKEEVSKHEDVRRTFELTNHGMNTLIQNMFQLNPMEFVNHVKQYATISHIIEIKKFEDFGRYFAGTKEIYPVLSQMNTHFTGQGRDLEQLKQIHVQIKTESSILFVGCSTGEEILDFQVLGFDGQYFGLDYDKKVIDEAMELKYKITPTFMVADVLDESFLSGVKKLSGKSSFDVVICRNLLIYYKDEVAKTIVERLAQLANTFLVLGMSDPFMFVIKDDEVKIGDSLFEVVDFENRIFKKKKEKKAG